MNNIKINIINKYIFIMMFLSIFLISYYVREPIFKSLASINIFFLLTLTFYIVINRNNINSIMFLYIVFLIIYVFIVDYLGNHDSISSIVRNIGMFFLPLFLVTVKRKSVEFKDIFLSSLKTINIFVIIIFIVGIIDIFIGFSIMKFVGTSIAPLLNVWIEDNAKLISYRYTSYMGHPLFTKELFIYFFLLNNIYYKKYKEKLLSGIIITSISLIGVLLTGSKVGIILILLCIIGTQSKKGKFKCAIASLILVIIVYTMGFFNTVLLRFQSGSLTTGRSEGWEYIMNYNFIKYKIFTGYGESLHSLLGGVVGESCATAGLEYPLRILLYKYGLFCLSMIVICIIIYPIVCLLKNKEFYVLFAFIIKLIDVNTYNGLIFKPDNVILFVLFTYILLSICNVNNKKNLMKEFDYCKECIKPSQ